MTDTQTALDSLEQHAARLQAHLADVRALLDDCAGVAALLPSADAEWLGLYWHAERTKSRLARCQVRIAEERRKSKAA